MRSDYFTIKSVSDTKTILRGEPIGHMNAPPLVVSIRKVCPVVSAATLLTPQRRPRHQPGHCCEVEATPPIRVRTARPHLLRLRETGRVEAAYRIRQSIPRSKHAHRA